MFAARFSLTLLLPIAIGTARLPHARGPLAVIVNMKYSFQKSAIAVLIIVCGSFIYSRPQKNLVNAKNNGSQATIMLEKDTIIEVKTDREFYKKSDTIRAEVSGLLWCTGYCEGTPHFGLLKQNVATWDTIVNLRDSWQRQVDCGPPIWNFQNTLFEISRQHISFNSISLSTGIYKLGVLSSDRSTIMYSEKFELE
jgi:hypothetical protein